jgi:hypothetical protein
MFLGEGKLKTKTPFNIKKKKISPVLVLYLACSDLPAYPRARGAEKNKIESDVYLADDKWGR